MDLAITYINLDMSIKNQIEEDKEELLKYTDMKTIKKITRELNLAKAMKLEGSIIIAKQKQDKSYEIEARYI